MIRNLRNITSVFLGLALCGSSAIAATLGFGLNGSCEVGSCPATSLGFNAIADLPIASTITLANGDTYSLTGTLTSSNDATGSSISLNYIVQVIYLGNGSGGASHADTLTLDLFSAFQSNFGTANFSEGLTGIFSPTIASTSAAQMCVATICTATVIPPGPFDVSASYSLAPSGGAFNFDNTITAFFGAGSPIGSYILFSVPPPVAPNVVGAISASAFGGFSSFAPGSWIEIYGTNLSTGTRYWGGEDFNGVNAPTALGGTSVTIGGAAAFVEYISPLQIDVQVPSGVGTGGQTLIVTTAAGSSAPFPVTLDAIEPGLLAAPSFKIGGVQYVVAQFADGTYVLPPGALAGVTSSRARPGDTIVIYGIGFGSVSPDMPAGELVSAANTLALPFTISIGGADATVTYDGLAPNYTGLYQFDVVVPNVAASDDVPVSFTLNGLTTTQILSLAVGN